MSTIDNRLPTEGTQKDIVAAIENLGTSLRPDFADLGDVSIDTTTLSDGQVPKWNNTIRKWENGDESGGTTVVANPTGTATGDLNSIQIGNDIYDITGSGGTTVIANPVGTATDELDTIQIGNIIYDIVGGGGSGGGTEIKTLTYTGNGTNSIDTGVPANSLVISIDAPTDSAQYKQLNIIPQQITADTPKICLVGPTITNGVLTNVSISENNTIVISGGYNEHYRFNSNNRVYTVTYIENGSGGGSPWKDITGTLTAGQTSITLSDASITTDSTIDVYTDTGVDYNTITVATGSVTLTFDSQSGLVNVKVRVS